MEQLKEKFNLTDKQSVKLSEVIDKLHSFINLDKQMDYVDSLSLEFIDDDDTRDRIDDYLRSLVKKKRVEMFSPFFLF